MSASEKKRPTPLVRVGTAASESSSESSSLRVPRTPRFAEATAVHSPIDGRNPFQDPPMSGPTTSYIAQEQVADMGFGYINDPSRPVEVPATPASPLKSALKVPGTPARVLSPMSATFREGHVLEKHEAATEKEQVKDLKIKTRVRLAKIVLRWTNFSCSLIVLALLASSLSVFNATRSLAPRNNLPPWANNTRTWPQILVLVVACISLALSIVVLWNYWRGGHRRAEKVAVYYTLFAVGFFIVSLVIWGVAAGILQGSRNSGNNKDIWGWACIDNKRRQIFHEDVNYALVCRMQNWSLICCIIEVVLETITIAIYGIVFYRYYTKNRLRKSMAVRDRARSDLYLAQLRSQSAPNTPGFGPLSPSYSANAKSPTHPASAYSRGGDLGAAEEGFAPGTRVVDFPPTSTTSPKPFALQKPPIRIHAASPRTDQISHFPSPSSSPSPAPQMSELAKERRLSHVEAAPGEQTYASVPIPGAYASSLASFALPRQESGMQSTGNLNEQGQMGMGMQREYVAQGHVPWQGRGHARQESIGEAVTSDVRIESPPGSPRGWR